MFQLKWILICFLLVGRLVDATSQSTPNQLTSYQLKLELQYPNSTTTQTPTQFHGHLVFNFLTSKDKEFLTLTISNLSLNSLKVYNYLGDSILINCVKVTQNEWKIRLTDWFLANQIYKIEIDYFGQFNQEDGGFFETKYKGKNGENRYLIASNPNGKFQKVMPYITSKPMGSIQLSVNMPFEWTAVFNSKEEAVNLDVNNPRMKIVKFKATAQMSFKNFLLVIGDFSVYEQKSKSGILVRSFIAQDFDDFLKETSQISANCLSVAESYFERPFGAEKMDHINALGDWSFSGLGISVYPKSNFSIWPNSASNELLAQKLLICKQTVSAWLNAKLDLENSHELFEALSMMLSYRFIAEFEDSDYAKVVNEEMMKLSSFNQISSKIDPINNSKYNPKELAAILLMIDDALGNQVFDYAMTLFIGMIQNQKSGTAISTLIEAFQQATDNVPICESITIKDLFESWLNQTGPVTLEISLKNGKYFIEQKSCTKRVVPLVIEELSAENFPTQWLMPTGKICSSGKIIELDSRIPYIFNANGKTYTRILYSDEIHRLFIEGGVWKIRAEAQYTYIRDLNEQIKSQPEKLNNLLDFIGNSFIDTQLNRGSPLFVDEAFKLLDLYYTIEPQKINSIMKRQIQTLHNSVFWQPSIKTLRNAMLSERILRRSVINRISGSRSIASNFYRQFLEKCAPDFDCSIFPVEILSAVLCGSVIENGDNEAKKLLSQMINNVQQRDDSFLFTSMERILNNAWQCVYED